MFSGLMAYRRPLLGFFALLSLGGCKARLEVETDHPLFPWDETSGTATVTSDTENPTSNGTNAADTLDTLTGSSGTSSEAESTADAGPQSPERAISWGPEMIINARDVNARNLQVTMDGAGNTLFVWRMAGPYDRSDGVYWRYYSRINGWSPIHQLASFYSEVTAGLQVCGNADGAAVITWTSTPNPSSEAPLSLWVAYYSADAVMFEPVELQDDTVVGSAGCAIDSSGEGMLVWSTESALAFSRGSESNWSQPEVIAGEAGSSQRLATNSQGNAVLVARRGSADAYAFFAVSYDANSGWGEAFALSVPGQSAAAPELPPFAVALGGDNRAHLVWAPSPAYDQPAEVWASTFTAGEGWRAPLLLTDEGTTGSAVVSVSANDAGRALMLWTAAAAGSFRVQGRRFLPDLGWESNDLFDEEGGPLYRWIPSSMSSAVAPNGRALAAFRFSDGGSDSGIAVLHIAPDGTVERFFTQRRGHDNMDPAVAMNAVGQAVVAWESFETISQAFVIFGD